MIAARRAGRAGGSRLQARRRRAKEARRRERRFGVGIARHRPSPRLRPPRTDHIPVKPCTAATAEFCARSGATDSSTGHAFASLCLLCCSDADVRSRPATPATIPYCAGMRSCNNGGQAGPPLASVPRGRRGRQRPMSAINQTDPATDADTHRRRDRRRRRRDQRGARGDRQGDLRPGDGRRAGADHDPRRRPRPAHRRARASPRPSWSRRWAPSSACPRAASSSRPT